MLKDDWNFLRYWYIYRVINKINTLKKNKKI